MEAYGKEEQAIWGFGYKSNFFQHDLSIVGFLNKNKNIECPLPFVYWQNIMTTLQSQHPLIYMLSCAGFVPVAQASQCWISDKHVCEF